MFKVGHCRLSDFIAEIIENNISLYLYLLRNQNDVQIYLLSAMRPPQNSQEQLHLHLLRKVFGTIFYEWPDLLQSGVLGRVLGRVLGEGARESAWEGARDLFLVLRKGGRVPPRAPSQALPQAPSQAASRAPHLGPALPQAPPGALFRVRGFGTSVAGQATRKNI